MDLLLFGVFKNILDSSLSNIFESSFWREFCNLYRQSRGPDGHFKRECWSLLFSVSLSEKKWSFIVVFFRAALRVSISRISELEYTPSAELHFRFHAVCKQKAIKLSSCSQKTMFCLRAYILGDDTKKKKDIIWMLSQGLRWEKMNNFRFKKKQLLLNWHIFYAEYQVLVLWQGPLTKPFFQVETYFDWLCLHEFQLPDSFCLQFILNQRSQNKFS